MKPPLNSVPPWFTDAKLGIFLHWGIYAVKGVGESWSFFNGDVAYEDYMAQLSGFTASKYNPADWARIIQSSGARYAVMTSKHHDGVALWDTRLSDLSVARQTPAQRDVLTPWAEAIRAAGLRVGIYFSHLDWNHPDYPSMLAADHDPAKHNNRFAHPVDGMDHPLQWKRYLEFQRGQIRELCDLVDPDLLWFDGDWEPRTEVWRFDELRRLIEQWRPGALVNSRMGGHGDYATPEQGIPTKPPEGPWEFCMTMNDSWGWQPQDKNYKSTRHIIRTFTEVIGMGGNLLLNISPKADGTLPAQQVRRLKSLGEWIEQHKEAVFSTTRGLPPGLFYGSSTLSEDHRSLYLFFYDKPWNEIAVKGILNKVKSVSLVGSGERLQHRISGGAPWAGVPGVLWIDIPNSSINRYATVVKVELDEPLQLWVKAGHAITAN